MKFSVFVSVLTILILSVYFLTSNGQDSTNTILSVDQVLDKISTDSTIFLLDVRTEPEFDGPLGHIEGSVLIPLSDLETRLEELEPYTDKEIIVICRSGNRSGKATIMLREEGFKAINMVGGMRSWNKMIESTQIDTTGNQNETITQ